MPASEATRPLTASSSPRFTRCAARDRSFLREIGHSCRPAGDLPGLVTDDVDEPSYAGFLQEADTLLARTRQLREYVPAVPLARCCPLGHALVESRNTSDGDGGIRVAASLRCDTCGSAVARGGGLYSCAPCDFDLCEACYRGEAAEGGAGAE